METKYESRPGDSHDLDESRHEREEAAFLKELAAFEDQYPDGGGLARQTRAEAIELEFEAEYLERRASESDLPPPPTPRD